MSTAVLTSLLDYLYGTLSPSNMRWVAAHLMEQADKEDGQIKPYTMKEVNAMLEESENDIAAGRVFSSKEVHDYIKMQKDNIIEPYTMQEIDEIFDVAEENFRKGNYITNEEVMRTGICV